MSPRLIPVDFLGNLGRSRSLSFCQINLRKITKERSKVVLEPTKFHCRTSNRFCFLKHSKNLSKKFWGWPGSPVPCLKNLEKILSVDMVNVLKSTDFRRLSSNRLRNNRLSTFWEFPLFSKLVKLISPKNRRQKSRFRLDYVLSWFNLLWLAEIWVRFIPVCFLEVVHQFGYILGSKFLKIPQKYSYDGKKCKLIRPIKVDE